MRYKNRLTTALFLIFLFFIFISSEDEIITISAKIEPTTIYVNEEFKIIVTIESNEPINIQELPEFDKIYEIKVLRPPQIEQKYEATYLSYRINKIYTSIITFFLICEEEVNIQGSSLKFKINNKIHILKDFVIPIISKSSIFTDLTFQNILSFSYEPKQIFIGQPLICEWILFSKQEIDRIDLLNLPLISGGVFKKIEVQNNKEVISLFDEQINKYTILKLLVLPDSTLLSFDKFDFKVFFHVNDEKKEYNLTFQDKKINIFSLPSTPQNFFGLIGNYSISYNFKRVENKNNIFYILEIIFTGKGNHRYINFKKLKIEQQHFNIFGPDIIQSEDSVILDYYLYPKQTGFINLDQINIPVFNTDKKDYDTFIIPKSTFYISQNFDQLFSSFNFTKNIQQFSNKNISNFFDLFNFIDIYLIFLMLFSLIIISLFVNKILNQLSFKQNIKKYDNQDIINLWHTFYRLNNFKNDSEIEKWIDNQPNRIKQIIQNVHSVYYSYFLGNSIDLNSRKIKNIANNFQKYLRKNYKVNK